MFLEWRSRSPESHSTFWNSSTVPGTSPSFSKLRGCVVPAARIPVKKITEVFRLKYAGGLSHAQIGQVCGISKGVITKYVSLAAGHGVTWPLPTELNEARLEGLLFHTVAKRDALAEPDYFSLHQALKGKGVTLQLLRSEYVAVHRERAYRYSQFWHRYHQWRVIQCDRRIAASAQ